MKKKEQNKNKNLHFNDYKRIIFLYIIYLKIHNNL